jgi:putative ABC transport system ATP-binding protein
MLVRSNRELGQTTLMITHNPEAASIANRILYMRDGQIVSEKKPSQPDAAAAAASASLVVPSSVAAAV